jgi:acetyl esterase/lipase
MSSENKPPGFEHVKRTLPIKNIQGKDLTVDVYYVDSEIATPQPVLLYFHGGFLVRESPPFVSFPT